MKKPDRGIEYEKQPDDRGLDIFSEGQLQNYGDLKQDRYWRQEFAEHQPQRMKGNIGCRVRAELAQPAAYLVAGEPYWWLFQWVPCR